MAWQHDTCPYLPTSPSVLPILILQGGLGSRLLVEPEDCMMACDLAQASGCDSFSYNPEQKKCFLKAGASTSTCQARPFEAQIGALRAREHRPAGTDHDRLRNAVLHSQFPADCVAQTVPASSSSSMNPQ